MLHTPGPVISVHVAGAAFVWNAIPADANYCSIKTYWSLQAGDEQGTATKLIHDKKSTVLRVLLHHLSNVRSKFNT